MNKSWKIAVAFLVVFVSGGAIGWISTLRYVKPPPPERPVTAPEEFGPNLLRRWVNQNQLNLTQAQRKQIMGTIIPDTAEDMRRLKREEVHSGQLIIEHMQDEIASVLTPDQRSKYLALIESERQQMNRFVQVQQRKALKQEEQQQTH